MQKPYTIHNGNSLEVLKGLEENSKHSKKPDEFRKRIERMFGDVPKVELFARQKTDGWDVWGNEVSSDVQIDNEQKEE